MVMFYPQDVTCPLPLLTNWVLQRLEEYKYSFVQNMTRGAGCGLHNGDCNAGSGRNGHCSRGAGDLGQVNVCKGDEKTSESSIEQV